MFLWLFDFPFWPSHCSCWLPLYDLWPSGANGTEPGFVSVALWLDWCRLIGTLTSFRPSLFLSLAPSRYSEMSGEWLCCWSASLYAASFVFIFPLFFHQRSQAAGWQGSQLTFRQGDRTFHPLFIPHAFSSLPLEHQHIPSTPLSGCKAVVGIWDQQGALYVELG